MIPLAAYAGRGPIAHPNRRQSYRCLCLWCEDTSRRLHGGLAHAFGLVGQHTHLILEEIGLDLGRVLHVLGLDKLVTEIESRGDVALHVTTELLGLLGDR